MLAATVGAKTCYVEAPSLAIGSGTATTRGWGLTFTPAGYVSKALAVEAPGRSNWTRTNIQFNTGASYQDFVGDWAGSENSNFDHSRKARGEGNERV